MRIKFYLALAAVVAFALPAWGADGDECDSDRTATTGGRIEYRGEVSGVYNETCHYLCQSDVAGQTACTEYDLQTADHGGYGDIYVFELHTATACSAAYAATISTNSTPGHAGHTVATLNGTTTRVEAGPGDASRFLNVALSNMTACTDFDVLIKVLRRKY